MHNRDENHLPVFSRDEGSYAWSRLAGYNKISGPRADVNTQDSRTVGVYLKAHKGEYTKNPIAKLLREEYFDHEVSIQVRFK